MLRGPDIRHSQAVADGPRTISPVVSDHRGFSRRPRHPSGRGEPETSNTLQQRHSQIVPENGAESDSSHVFPDYCQLVPDRTPVLALGDLDLSPRFIEVQPAPNLGGQSNDTAALDRHETMESHSSIIP